MQVGRFGSTFHVLRADAGTVAALAAVDWNRSFRRVCLDPVGGLIVLMSPSRLHDELTRILDHVVDVAGSALTGAVNELLAARLRQPGSPPGTGMEPDCAFYLGERAIAYREALAAGKEAADAFFDENAPDLVVEIEMTNTAAQSKIERYGDLGVRELWRLEVRSGSGIPRTEFLALRPGTAPHRLSSSDVLRGLTPADISEAVADVRLGLTRDERTEAVARIVRRRQRASVRVRDAQTTVATVAICPERADQATMHSGPFGSTFHVLRADADTVTALAAIDWNRWFRRVCLDPLSGLIVLMSPSRLHEDLGGRLDNVVDVAASALTGAARGLRSPRLRAPDAPAGTGMEPDCAFYVGERARAYRAAFAGGGHAAADAFFENNAPDLVVEVEITNAVDGKIGRYGDLGVRELWLLHARGGADVPRVEFLALGVRTTPRPLAASTVLAGLTPTDVREALGALQGMLTRDERTEAVARIVRRRQRASVRLREGEAAAHPNAGDVTTHCPAAIN